MIILLALLIGVVAGLRAMTAPAAVSWGAALGHYDVSNSDVWFMGLRWTPWILTLLACVELVTDQLLSTPSRKVPPQFSARVIMGGLSGATLGASANSLLLGAFFGVVGAVVGTLGGAWARQTMAANFGSDRPAAFIEDAVAIIGAALIVLPS